ncbi:hypothetical protein NL676_026299 [Syzygium grande]|nr:hypothetical protein NL676_026299 [Syzygium grande]
MGDSMLLHRLPLRVVLLLCTLVALFSIVSADVVPTTKPGCTSRCGNLTFSYPFGMNNTGNDCHFKEESDSFLIFCDNSTDPPTPYMSDRSSNLQILNISIENHEINVMVDVAEDCYNLSGGNIYNFEPWLTLAIFPMSTAKNKFIAVGCDTSCSGIGCCETSIPGDSYQYNISVTSKNNHTGIWEFNQCGYAFVAEDGFFNFSADDLYKLPFDTVPIVLDWLIPYETCDEAKKNTTTYTCQENSNCTDAENGSGYQCNCLEGYQGNPYLQNGCQDINECVVSQPCSGICTNLPGTYNCSCLAGYQGDGRKDGKGCTLIPQDKRFRSTNVVLGLMRMMDRHPWVNQSRDLEEAEHLLGEISSKCDDIPKSTASGNDDSISTQAPFELESGR